MREGPLAELFRATDAAQRQAEKEQPATADAPTVEHAGPEQEPVTEAGAAAPAPDAQRVAAAARWTETAPRM
ncbi:MAG: hypothetical protein M3304_05910, partial [Actinomycetota bacterium]|nr:hypothetical protein [Actinomycetota bacterium]